jgi:hypothetical protein
MLVILEPIPLSGVIVYRARGMRLICDVVLGYLVFSLPAEREELCLV